LVIEERKRIYSIQCKARRELNENICKVFVRAPWTLRTRLDRTYLVLSNGTSMEINYRPLGPRGRKRAPGIGPYESLGQWRLCPKAAILSLLADRCPRTRRDNPQSRFVASDDHDDALLQGTPNHAKSTSPIPFEQEATASSNFRS
jgi:hypothetical protein